MKHPQPNPTIIEQRTVALPLVESGELIEEETALSFLQALITNHSEIIPHIRAQVAKITREIQEKLDQNPSDKTYIVTPVELRGIIARAAIVGAAQSVSDIGQTLVDIDQFKGSLALRGDSVFQPEDNLPLPDDPPLV